MTAVDTIGTSLGVERRALPNSPNGYVPSEVECSGDDRPTVRDASSLSPAESDWLETRRTKTLEPMQDLLERLGIPDFDVDEFMNDKSDNLSALPNIGIAFSGGGYRALQYGAGVMAAFDSRTDDATSDGHLGGLLQSATYVSGLSGGGWLTGSIFLNNFTSVQALQNDPDVSAWNFANSIVDGPATSGNEEQDTSDYLRGIASTVDNKEDAGFETTLTDYWGRALSFQMIDAEEGGPAITWSSIAETEAFENGEMPMPIILAVEQSPGTEAISRTANVYEFNPLEMGTWDPTAFAFVPMKHLGSEFESGSLANEASCVVGFDNAGFLMGTSSSLFNAALTRGSDTLPESVQDALSSVLGFLGGDDEDIAAYPNPFFQYNTETNRAAESEILNLVDAGLDFQNIPLQPLIQPVREVDVIFAVDASGDTTYSWPNGTALVTTFERSQPDVDIANGTAFPAIPDVNTMVNLGLNRRPTFFGCEADNITTDYAVPLVVYLPHSPYSFYSNYSTFGTQTFSDTTRNAIIQNGYNVATMANGTATASSDDEETENSEDWSTCVGCAIITRSLRRAGTDLPDACNRCFEQYCWDGTLEPEEPEADYDPALQLEEEQQQQPQDGEDINSALDEEAGKGGGDRGEEDGAAGLRSRGLLAAFGLCFSAAVFVFL